MAVCTWLNRQADNVSLIMRCSGSATATFHIIGLPIQRSEAHIQAIAQTVKEIVNEVIKIDDRNQLCLEYLAEETQLDQNLKNFCETVLKENNAQISGTPT